MNLVRKWSFRTFAGTLFFLCLILPKGEVVAVVSEPTPVLTAPSEYVILFVLEGFGQDSLKGGTMPTLSRLIREGSVTWSATAVKPAFLRIMRSP